MTSLLSICPTLVPIAKENYIHYTGYITVKDAMFRISVETRANQESLRGAKFRCDWKMKQLLKNHLTVLQQLLNQSKSIENFISELKNLLENQLENSLQLTLPPPATYYQSIIKDIEEVGWKRLVCVDETFRDLKLLATDEAERHHVLGVRLSAKHPDEKPECSCDLPAPFEPVWNAKSHLKSLLDQFEQQLGQFQNFWNMFDELDSATWVLEPDNPSRSACARRIALGQMASIQIKVNPNHPSVMPDVQFLGADHVIQPLKRNLNENIHLWDAEKSLFKNLTTVLATEFPSPATTKKEDFSIECGICYSYRLDDQLPDHVCNDERCGQPFHHACLFEWLRALPSSRQSFNTVFGECPYCSKPITVRMPTK